MGASFGTAWRQVAKLATGQHGMVTTRQLAELGVGRRAIARAVDAGRLHRVHVGVYAVGHVPTTRAARWMAAVLACGPGAALSHRSAAALLGFRDGDPSRPEVTIPPGSGRSRPGILIHRSPLAANDVIVHDGIRVTSHARTLSDLSRVLDPADLTRATRELQWIKRFDLEAVQEVLARRPSQALTELIADLVAAQSFTEDDFLRLCERYGIPRPRTQYAIDGHHVDFAWPERRVVVEGDGWDGHRTRSAFQRDRAQTNAMQLAGFVVLRFTGADVRRRPERTARQVLRALRDD